jgi:myo-inositol-1(or 4)-monophosphatase
MTVEPTRLLAIALSVTRGAAELARQMRVEGVSGVTTKSTETDVVTAADQATERYVREELHRLRPDDAVLGEEAGLTAGVQVEETGQSAGAVRWIVDPIDGTVNYLYGIPHYAVSLAAEVDGIVVAGVVRNAATGEEWTATLGGGAWRGDVRLSGSGVTHLGQSLIATGFGYAAARREHQARVVGALLPMVRDIRRFGAASLDLCYAAEGRVDGYYEKGLNLWDHAAGGLVATEAGLRVGGLAGAAAGLDLVVAAAPGIWSDLHDALAGLDAAGGP